MSEEIKKTDGEIDKEVLDEIYKAKVDLCISDEKQMRRTELNCYAELLSQLKELSANTEKVYQTLNMIGADKLTEYFKELTKNYKEEEARAKVRKKVSKSHLRKSKSV